MAIAWYICPYLRKPPTPMQPVTRELAMADFTAQIQADGGDWSEVEVLGNRAIVKVNALQITLDAISAASGIRLIPLTMLDSTLNTLNNPQRTAVHNELLDAGYTAAEIDAAFPNFSNATFRAVLEFLAQRRREPRYDPGTDTIFLDGPVRVCGKTIQKLDSEI